MSRDEKRHVVSLQKHRARRRKRIISLVVLALLIVVVGVVLSLTVFFHITEIAVQNVTVYSESDIIDSSGITLHSNMFLIDAKQAAADIEKKLPYIESVTVKRSLTGKLTLIVEETKAAMAFTEDDGYLLISPKGKVLERSLLISEHVCLVKGLTYSSAVEGETIRIDDMLASDGTTVLRDGEKLLDDLILAYGDGEKYFHSDISEINLSNINNLYMVYQYRILLKCGDISKLDQTLKFAGAIIERLDGENPLYRGTVDLTIENKAFYNEGDFEVETEEATEPVTEKPQEQQTDENGEPVTTQANEESTGGQSEPEQKANAG
jgi:hypothetical protein